MFTQVTDFLGYLIFELLSITLFNVAFSVVSVPVGVVAYALARDSLIVRLLARPAASGTAFHTCFTWFSSANDITFFAAFIFAAQLVPNRFLREFNIVVVICYLARVITSFYARNTRADAVRSLFNARNMRVRSLFDERWKVAMIAGATGGMILGATFTAAVIETPH